MHVALVITDFGGTRGGAERMCLYLARGLADRNHRVDVYAARFPGSAIHPKIKNILIEVSDAWPGRKYTTFAENVAAKLDGAPYDVVHSFARTVRQDIYRLGGGCHIEYLKRTDEERGRLTRWFRRHNPKEQAILELERRAMSPECTRTVAAVSEQSAREAGKHYDVDPARLHIVRNGVDTTLFHPRNVELSRMRTRADLGIGGDAYLVLFAGSGFERKGLRAAVEAIAQVPEARLLVIGRGRTGRYEEQAQRLNCADRVTFGGHRGNPEDFYAAADVLVLPSLYDPFPNVCLEAMATGIPVVTTRVTGVSEILEQGRDGIVIERGTDVEALAGALRTLADAGRRREMGAAARATAEAYNVEKFVEANLALYELLCKQEHC